MLYLETKRLCPRVFVIIENFNVQKGLKSITTSCEKPLRFSEKS